MNVPRVLSKNLENLYLVGGAVRDILLGKVPSEFDLITTSSFESVPVRTFAPSKDGKTVGVFLKGVKYDITRYEDLREDLERRDFTINSMAIPVSKDGALHVEQIIDFFGGLKDLRDGILRSVKFENMLSDPVRTIRGLRFVSEYALKVDNDTLNAMKLGIKRIRTCARERLYPPLEKFVNGTYILRAVNIAKEIDTQRYLSLPLVNMEKVASLTVECRWPAIFLETDDFEKFVEIVFPPRRMIKRVLRLNRILKKIKENDLEWTVEVKKIDLKCLLELTDVFSIPNSKLKMYSQMELALSPRELKDIGFEGKRLKFALSRLWNMVLDGELKNERGELMNFLRNWKYE